MKVGKRLKNSFSFMKGSISKVKTNGNDKSTHGAVGGKGSAQGRDAELEGNHIEHLKQLNQSGTVVEAKTAKSNSSPMKRATLKDTRTTVVNQKIGLIIRVKNAQKLRAQPMDEKLAENCAICGDNDVDPYCSIEVKSLQPGFNMTKVETRRTRTVKKSLNPRWDEEFHFEVHVGMITVIFRMHNARMNKILCKGEGRLDLVLNQLLTKMREYFLPLEKTTSGILHVQINTFEVDDKKLDQNTATAVKCFPADEFTPFEKSGHSNFEIPPNLIEDNIENGSLPKSMHLKTSGPFLENKTKYVPSPTGGTSHEPSLENNAAFNMKQNAEADKALHIKSLSMIEIEPMKSRVPVENRRSRNIPDSESIVSTKSAPIVTETPTGEEEPVPKSFDASFREDFSLSLFKDVKKAAEQDHMGHERVFTPAISPKGRKALRSQSWRKPSSKRKSRKGSWSSLRRRSSSLLPNGNLFAEFGASVDTYPILRDEIDERVRLLGAEIRREVEMYRTEAAQLIEFVREDIKETSKLFSEKLGDVQEIVKELKKNTASAESWAEITQRQNEMRQTLLSMQSVLNEMKRRKNSVKVGSVGAIEITDSFQMFQIGSTIGILVNYFFEGILVIGGLVFKIFGFVAMLSTVLRRSQNRHNEDVLEDKPSI
mmetsp:Transcript_6144/g.14814  ORF Transcript_6144/g.14814 Transcript_6144/m.14814 type:complete len:654 (-) Transcript_6144:78-2039(-)|eukprot:CAMPEP_0114523172 /NCGR_PEP_ID=MMETSP0109-20121206/21148_1 /TAXON_ID=29199 /ORGANISM="Chlorarachnion reptans, Strain CCCM449" /LENGTH=653 /DNA_ID=CAMNT_0001704467 /DNA_START=11 /DNA_END=1972 /DNA_ORIENTATION=-